MKRPWKAREKRLLQTSLTLDFLLFNFFLLLLVLIVYLMVSLDVVDFRISDQVVDPNLNVEAHMYVEELENEFYSGGGSVSKGKDTEIQRLKDSGAGLKFWMRIAMSFIMWETSKMRSRNTVKLIYMMDWKIGVTRNTIIRSLLSRQKERQRMYCSKSHVIWSACELMIIS